MPLLADPICPSALQSRASVRDDPLKQAPLFGPLHLGRDRPQLSFVDALGARQEEPLLLNVWRQVEQPHDLRHAGARDPTPPRDIRVIATD